MEHGKATLLMLSGLLPAVHDLHVEVHSNSGLDKVAAVELELRIAVSSSETRMAVSVGLSTATRLQTTERLPREACERALGSRFPA